MNAYKIDSNVVVLSWTTKRDENINRHKNIMVPDVCFNSMNSAPI